MTSTSRNAVTPPSAGKRTPDGHGARPRHRRRRRGVALAAFASLALLGASDDVRHEPNGISERIETQDNLRPAGAIDRGELRLTLDTRVGTWYPDGDEMPGALVPAFAEAGHPLQIPGPLVRVPAGTNVVVTVKNSMADGVLTLHGLVSRPLPAGASDSVQVAPGASQELRFRLDKVGTFYYWGTTTGRPFSARTGRDAQLSGAIVVDERGIRPPPDRIMLIGSWADTNSGAARAQGVNRTRLLAVVNGRSWPHTTRLAYTLGDTVRWRIINASADLHPMHLHGFFYAVDGRGNGTTDTTYAEARRDHVVTELLSPGRTMAMRWSPERSGNWLFHCHSPTHFAPRGSLGMPRTPDTDSTGRARAHHVANHALDEMNGLVVGVTITPRRHGNAHTVAGAPVAARRHLRLLVRPSAGGATGRPYFAFTLLERGSAEPPADSGFRSGPPIVLTRGVPVSIMVVNRLTEPTAVHWHGMELESYFDGVSGFSGSAQRITPVIAPADSFEARFTPPRAGTFIYHTHIDEERQQPAGLSGALIVVDPAQPFNAATDIPVLVTSPSNPTDEARHVLINGSLAPALVDVRVGVPLRLRFINITVGRAGMHMALLRDTTLLSWRPLAKDGADLPEWRRVTSPARLPLSIGETADVEFTPMSAGAYRIAARGFQGTYGVLTLRAREVGRTPGP